MVGTWVLDEPDALVGDVLGFGGGHVDAVHPDGRGDECAEFFEAVGGGLVSAIEGVGDVGRALGDVDVDSDAEFTGFLAGVTDGVVGAGELGVEADQSFDEGTLVFADKADAFVDAAFALGLAVVAVGGAVGQQAAGTELFVSIGQGVEGTLDVVGGFVVIDDRRRAAQEAFGDIEARGGAQDVFVDGPVEPPPYAFQDLREVFGGMFGGGHAVGAERAIKVGVRTDPSGEDFGVFGFESFADIEVWGVGSGPKENDLAVFANGDITAFVRTDFETCHECILHKKGLKRAL